ncbi:MAG: family 16 glycoside hydrolase, partial [Phycisphaerales bacterium]
RRAPHLSPHHPRPRPAPLLTPRAATVARLFAAPAEPTPIRARLITGANHHNWQYTSRVHKETLEATGRFTVDITESPATLFAESQNIEPYEVFILDYNDAKRWPTEAEAHFSEAVRNGTGVVAIHAANNAFEGWAEYEEMLALLWRKGAGHGSFHAFDIVLTGSDNPITKGLDAIKAHPDELYHGLTNPRSAKYTLLARAVSDRAKGGTGNAEPMAIAREFGKGRVFATMLGHVWKDSDETKPSVHSTGFRTLLARGCEWAATGAVTISGPVVDTRTHNTLSPAEETDGYKLLFDGRSSQFRAFKGRGMPEKGWIIDNGELVHTRQGGGGDIVTIGQYSDFELRLDWKVEKGGNSGVIYRCTEDHTYPWETGPEMQILDDANHKDGKKPATRAGTLYDLLPCEQDVSRPAGEWNSAALIVRGSRIQHWLNGFKVVDVDTAGATYLAAHKASKWPGMKDFNTKPEGHIALQDHGDEVRFRNIKIRVLKPE